eukprot:CAMPEP_0182546354 /NCGR_PEP_ID=MMETSP1323-20130603/35929_1 /TAXON_ID=236787 /ORGANISM="Florenciella parvula, Strain RCC1693" /LENGTH=112 /DNA_ID=CAMNT_0024757573 /DNA_START=366 /DNA_END=700 /DNA_ORIENTATION=+
MFVVRFFKLAFASTWAIFGEDDAVKVATFFWNRTITEPFRVVALVFDQIPYVVVGLWRKLAFIEPRNFVSDLYAVAKLAELAARLVWCPANGTYVLTPGVARPTANQVSDDA